MIVLPATIAALESAETPSVVNIKDEMERTDATAVGFSIAELVEAVRAAGPYPNDGDKETLSPFRIPEDDSINKDWTADTNEGVTIKNKMGSLTTTLADDLVVAV